MLKIPPELICTTEQEKVRVSLQIELAVASFELRKCWNRSAVRICGKVSFACVCTAFYVLLVKQQVIRQCRMWCSWEHNNESLPVCTWHQIQFLSIMILYLIYILIYNYIHWSVITNTFLLILSELHWFFLCHKFKKVLRDFTPCWHEAAHSSCRFISCTSTMRVTC